VGVACLGGRTHTKPKTPASSGKSPYLRNGAVIRYFISPSSEMPGPVGRVRIITDEITNDVPTEGSELRTDKRRYSDGLDDPGSIPGSASF
jgi:hypothetical protein